MYYTTQHCLEQCYEHNGCAFSIIPTTAVPTFINIASRFRESCCSERLRAVAIGEFCKIFAQQYSKFYCCAKSSLHHHEPSLVGWGPGSHK